MKKILYTSMLLVFALLLGSADSYAAKKKAEPSPSAEAEPRQITDFTKKSGDEKISAGDKEAKESAPAEKKSEGLYSYEEPTVEEPSMGWMFFKTVFILGIFGAAFYFFFKYVKKKTGLAGVGQGAAQVLSVVPLGPNKFLQVVDMGGRLLILGVTDGAITLIADVRERDEIDRLRLMSSKQLAAPHYGFHDFVSEHVSSLIDYIGKKRSGSRKKSDDTHNFHTEYVEEEKIDYLKTQRDRLRRMNGEGGSNER